MKENPRFKTHSWNDTKKMAKPVFPPNVSKIQKQSHIEPQQTLNHKCNLEQVEQSQFIDFKIYHSPLLIKTARQQGKGKYADQQATVEGSELNLHDLLNWFPKGH